MWSVGYAKQSSMLSRNGAATMHQRKFSMCFVLAVAAGHGQAGITNFTEAILKE